MEECSRIENKECKDSQAGMSLACSGSPPWSDSREQGGRGRDDLMQGSRGQITWAPGQCEMFAFYSDLWKFEESSQHCNYAFSRILQFSIVFSKTGATHFALRPDFRTGE